MRFHSLHFRVTLCLGLLLAAPAIGAAERVDRLLQRAQEHSAHGRHTEAVTNLEQAAALANKQGDAAMRLAAHAQLGGAYLRAGRHADARAALNRALTEARERDDAKWFGPTLNDLGMLHEVEGDAHEALRLFQDARQATRDAAQTELFVTTTLNAALMANALRQHGRALALALEARETAASLSPAAVRATAQLRTGAVMLRIAEASPGVHDRAVREAHTPLQAAQLAVAEQTEPVLQSIASGLLGAVYLAGRRYAEAQTLTEQAIAHARRERLPALLFQWQWQAARIHRALKRDTDAIAAYRLAIAAHAETALLPSPAALAWLPARDAQQAHLELADLLLAGSDAIRDTNERRAVLREARERVEHYKARELQDYFRDNCVAQAQARVRTLDSSLGVGTAVLYPIVFADRLELLVSNGTDIERVAVRVRAAEVKEIALRFREALQDQRGRDYLPLAQSLHRWLLAPVEPVLQRWNTTTLITVPDTELRAIPFAALHDGERFVMQRYALATVPSLELTDPRPLPAGRGRALLGGVSEAVQGYPALANVDTELASLRETLGGTVLRNETFTRSRLERELTGQRLSIAHIASHGEFSGDVRQSFVLTHDSKLSVDQLAQYIGYNRLHDDPLDLLTLSACQTAAGDTRAALGLAGLAVKAGARSALASLWAIHDEATSILMTEFYQQLKKPGMSKAAALQAAQQKLSAITRYRHPGYWSAFVLIGSWL